MYCRVPVGWGLQQTHPGLPLQFKTREIGNLVGVKNSAALHQLSYPGKSRGAWVRMQIAVLLTSLQYLSAR